jgi:5-formyltetrahydrofolate cyclo-ligase
MTGTSRIPCASIARSTPEAAPGSPSQKDAPKQQSVEAGALPDDAVQAAKAAKAALRRHLKAERASLDGPGKRERDARIGEQVIAWWRRTRPPLLAVYWPLSGEPDLAETYALLAREGAQLALPVVVRRHAALEFAAWTPGEAMALDPMGIAVPAELRTVARPPALLVPCLGFNEQGYRLGYGGGFYDRTLADGVRPATLGIAYACQATAFAVDSHDVPLDLVVTETTKID